MLAADSNALDTVSRAIRETTKSAGWKNIALQVQPFLDQVAARLIDQIRGFDEEIGEYAQYALTQQGKQLRPALVALSAGTVGAVNDSIVTVATIIEMIHLATLVHDDIMDSARVRRGRPSVDARWGSQISVLVGDSLFAQALHLAASFPGPEICRAVSAATKTVCSGEILQSQLSRCFDLDRAEYFKILQMKTGELFALSCEMGASLAGASPSENSRLQRYGLLLGTAYQVYDDCVDVFGSEESAGKSLGTDLASGKITLPVLVLLERANDREKIHLQHLINSWTRNCLPEVLELLEKHDVLKECQRVTCELSDEAKACLQPLPHSPSRDALQELTSFFSQQTGALGVDH